MVSRSLGLECHLDMSEHLCEVGGYGQVALHPLAVTWARFLNPAHLRFLGRPIGAIISLAGLLRVKGLYP